MRSLFQRIAHSYSDLRLQKKLMLTLLLSVGIPLLVTIALLAPALYRMAASDTIRSEQDASALVLPELSEALSSLPALADQIEADSFYQALLACDAEEELLSLAGSKEELSLAERIDEKKSHKKSDEKKRDEKEKDLLTDVRLYLPLPQEPSGAGLIASDKEILGTYWHGILSARRRRELFCSATYLGPRERENHGSLLYVRPFYLLRGRQTGYLAIYFSEEVLRSLLASHLVLPRSVSYLIDDRDEIGVTTDASLSGIYHLSYDTIQGSVLAFNHFAKRQVLGETVYAGYYRVEPTGWLMVTVLPERELAWLSAGVMVRLGLALLGVIILAAFLFSALSRSITRRIESVITQMQTVRTGVPVPMDSPQSLDEIGDLIDSYNYMARRMGQLIQNQARAAEDLRRAEFNSLQAQMNPHFLYNAMDMIHWMALQGQTSQITETVQMLSRFYRLTLSHKEALWTIEQEIEHVSIYVRLQDLRFGGRITYVCDVPDELLPLKIPKLTLQPVVENAILHGLLETPEKGGTIVLTGWTEGSDVLLLISDDGAGMDQERLATILTGQGPSTRGGTNIAVSNTHRRLGLLYGPGYGLSYQSAPGEGCEVTIRFPLTH